MKLYIRTDQTARIAWRYIGHNALSEPPHRYPMTRKEADAFRKMEHDKKTRYDSTVGYVLTIEEA